MPTIFQSSLLSDAGRSVEITEHEIETKTLALSRVVSVLLIIAYAAFVWFQVSYPICLIYLLSIYLRSSD